MKILLTSGGTKVSLDSVRSITNMSHGTFGNHICHALLELGHEVIFLYAKGSKCPHEYRADLSSTKNMKSILNLARQIDFYEAHKDKYIPVQYNDFGTYSGNLLSLLTYQKPNITILAAAVSDYAPVKVDGKISSDLEKVTINLEQTPKLIRQVKTILPSTYLVGFKLLVNSTKEELHKAMEKQRDKAMVNMVVGNDLRDIKADKHTLTLLSKYNQHEELEPSGGLLLARELVNKIMDEIEVEEETPHVMDNEQPSDWR
jgi:phosphopantothenoylcysteine synthetase/decarboxylase